MQPFQQLYISLFQQYYCNQLWPSERQVSFVIQFSDPSTKKIDRQIKINSLYIAPVTPRHHITIYLQDRTLSQIDYFKQNDMEEKVTINSSTFINICWWRCLSVGMVKSQLNCFLRLIKAQFGNPWVLSSSSLSIQFHLAHAINLNGKVRQPQQQQLSKDLPFNCLSYSSVHWFSDPIHSLFALQSPQRRY